MYHESDWLNKHLSVSDRDYSFSGENQHSDHSSKMQNNAAFVLQLVTDIKPDKRKELKWKVLWDDGVIFNQRVPKVLSLHVTKEKWAVNKLLLLGTLYFYYCSFSFQKYCGNKASAKKTSRASTVISAWTKPFKQPVLLNQTSTIKKKYHNNTLLWLSLKTCVDFFAGK